MSIPPETVRDGVQRLRCWLDSNLEEFRPQSRDVPWLEDVKPLVELGLVLYGLAGHGTVASGARLARWINQTTEVLWSYAETFGTGIDWRGLTAAVVERPNRGLAVTPFLLFEALTGRTSAVHHEARAVLSAVDAIGTPDLDVAFLLDIAAIRSCEGQAVEALQHWAASTAADYDVEMVSSGYELTHLIFYATRMGRRRPTWHETLDAWLHRKIVRLTEAALRRGDIDLGAELLLAMAWAGGRHSPAFRAGLDALTTAATSDAGIPLYKGSFDPGRSEFRNRYHATLVVLAALSVATI